MENANDNERLSFIKLAAATANVTSYLFEEKQVCGQAEAKESERERKCHAGKTCRGKFSIGRI